MEKKMPQKDRVFMSYRHKRIWVSKVENCEFFYMVAKGDGTDEYFKDWKDAMDWIDEKQDKRKGA